MDIDTDRIHWVVAHGPGSEQLKGASIEGVQPSLETIAMLRPDLVVAWEEAGTARIRPRLEALGDIVDGGAGRAPHPSRSTAGVESRWRDR